MVSGALRGESRGAHQTYATSWTASAPASWQSRQRSLRSTSHLLSVAEVELLLRQCSRRAPTAVRNRALIAVLWRCVLRLGEALALKAKDFDPEAGTLVVQRGKGGKRRVVGVDAGTVALVGRWLELRRKRSIAGGPLFCTLAGRPSRRSAACTWLRDHPALQPDDPLGAFLRGPGRLFFPPSPPWGRSRSLAASSARLPRRPAAAGLPPPPERTAAHRRLVGQIDRARGRRVMLHGRQRAGRRDPSPVR